MLKECNLSFVENSILTKEILVQMNQEPKWLFLSDKFRDIEFGIISGFEFRNSTIDDFSVMTKGNILINGKWYRMDEDYRFNGDTLESGRFYHIVLHNELARTYEIKIIDNRELVKEDICIAKFKYEYNEHNRVFRIPYKLSELCKKNAVLHDIKIPYYNNYGVAVCPPHIAICIKNSLAEKEKRSLKEELIFQRLLNEKMVAIDSLLDFCEMNRNENLMSDNLMEQLLKKISRDFQDYKVQEKIIVNETKDVSNSSTRKRQRGTF